MGHVGERKNLLQEEFGEGSYSSCVHHEGLWHISCSGRGLPLCNSHGERSVSALEPPYRLALIKKGNYLLVYNPTCSTQGKAHK